MWFTFSDIVGWHGSQMAMQIWPVVQESTLPNYLPFSDQNVAHLLFCLHFILAQLSTFTLELQPLNCVVDSNILNISSKYFKYLKKEDCKKSCCLL